MMKNTIQNLAVLLLIFLTTISIAQDRRTLETKIADILAQMPVKNIEHRDRLAEETLELGEPGFQQIAEQLVEPGTGNDVAARFIIASMAEYFSAFGLEKEKYFVEGQLLKALERKQGTGVKSFLMSQLNFVATDKTIQEVARYLGNADLVEPATHTILSVGGKEAAKAFMAALPGVSEKCQPVLIKALGELKCTAAVQQITAFASSGNQNLKKVSLAALANIGDPASYKILFKAAENAGFGYDQANSTDAFLNYIDRLGETGQNELCKKACDAIIANVYEAEKLHYKSKVLSIYAKYYGSESLPLLLKAVDNPSKPFRVSVLDIAAKTGDVAATRMWIEKAGKSSEELKSEIIAMLGRRGDQFAAGFVIEGLNDPSAVVRHEAISAVTALKEKEAVPILIDHLAKGTDIGSTKKALLQLLDQKHLAPVSARLNKVSGKTKAAFIDIIAAKSGKAYFDQVFSITKSTDKDEKSAAFNALKKISAEENLPQLIDLLLSINSDEEISQVQLAVIAASKGVESEKTEKGLLLSTLKNTDKKERIIPVLPEVGGKIALETVTGYFNNSGGKIKEASFNAITRWREFEASQALFGICQNGGTEYHERAFSSFIKLVGGSGVPDDQKLLQYRKVMPITAGIGEKVQVINAVGNLKTFLSLVFLNSYLNTESLQQPAAHAIIEIALPGRDQPGFSGDIVKGILEKVMQVISGDESDYDKANIKNYLDNMPKEKGFVSMFNGKDFEGWQGLVENPVKRAKMTPAELAKKQEEANRKMLENWRVENGMIVFSGKGDNLCSIKEYGDFEMVVDWKITKKGDSGIYLRGTPQVQIWDTSRVEVGAQVGSGGLYNNQKNRSKPLKVADNPVDDWNTFRITMIGENVTVYLNGELVVDNVPLENYWDRSQPIFKTGPIELQAHGNELAFRDIYVREIDSKNSGLTETEISEGFESLFNGKNLDGWQGNLTDYFAENGEMVVNPKLGGHGNIYTEKEYSDFILRFDFQLTPAANNGLGIRAPLEGDAAYVGMEIQILDNTDPVYANLHEYQYHGSVYGVIPAKREFLKPLGEWNSEEVIAKGTHIKVILNGETIVDGDIKEASRNGTLDGKDHSGLLREKGYIGFLGHGSELKFRNLRIKDLSK